ncbi:MAG: hypothetical protein CVV42_18505 [Candidatus Riflebacteria bacterium HGW-Riflebacteria-2]|jgi:plasmid stabilization system protein ParE|nr:MAG: hypothetical protein CVV42_18505 [Candidatus Riflebacteria bacterium HGW-Riflebacteria-2]
MRVEILSTAENDLEKGFRFYEAQSAGLGAYFLDSIFSEIDSLAFFAGIHQKCSGYYRLLAKKFPFAIYYNIQDSVIMVFAVLDCRQKPSWIRKKLMNY